MFYFYFIFRVAIQKVSDAQMRDGRMGRVLELVLNLGNLHLYNTLHSIHIELGPLLD